MASTIVAVPLEFLEGGLSQLVGQCYQLLNVFCQRLCQNHLGMSYQAATAHAGEHEACLSKYNSKVFGVLEHD